MVRLRIPPWMMRVSRSARRSARRGTPLFLLSLGGSLSSGHEQRRVQIRKP